MSIKFICPYCQAIKGSKGYFNSWVAVTTHARYCSKNNKEYIFNTEFGAVHYSELSNTPLKDLKSKFGDTKLKDMNKKFKSIGLITKDIYRKWDEQDVINAIQYKAKLLGRVPNSKDFRKTEGKYPSINCITPMFGSWLKALAAAGFIPEYSGLYGVPTIGLDGIKYRSKGEAYFCDTFLFGKFSYDNEVSYKNSDLRYDWYIPSLNLYIELDGGCRENIIVDKININKQQNIHCLFIPYKEIYYQRNKTLYDFINNNNLYIKRYTEKV